MSGDKVKFNNLGEYKIGDDLVDMNVQQKTTKDKNRTTSKPTKPILESGGNAVKEFNLDSLRKKAGVSKKPKAEVSFEETKPVENDKLVVEEVIKESIAEIPTPHVSVEPEVSIEESEPIAEVTMESSENDSVLTQVKSLEVTPPTQEFSLQKLNLDGTQRLSENVDIEPRDVAVEFPTPEENNEKAETAEIVGEMNIIQNTPKQEQIISKEELPTSFDIFTATDLFGVSSLSDISTIVVDWVTKLLKEYPKHPSAIFEAKEYVGLRAYSIFFVTKGRASYPCITIGMENRITAVTLDEGKNSLLDYSSKLTTSGKCVLAGTTPLVVVDYIRRKDVIKL